VGGEQLLEGNTVVGVSVGQHEWRQSTSGGERVYVTVEIAQRISEVSNFT